MTSKLRRASVIFHLLIVIFSFCRIRSKSDDDLAILRLYHDYLVDYAKPLDRLNNSIHLVAFRHTLQYIGSRNLLQAECKLQMAHNRSHCFSYSLKLNMMADMSADELEGIFATDTITSVTSADLKTTNTMRFSPDDKLASTPIVLTKEDGYFDRIVNNEDLSGMADTLNWAGKNNPFERPIISQIRNQVTKLIKLYDKFFSFI